MKSVHAISAVVVACVALSVGVVLADKQSQKTASPPSAPPVSAMAYARGVLPDAKRTPGAINPAVTDATISKTIAVSGWTSTIRPPASYTTKLKKKQLASGYAVNGDMNPSDYEEDHLVSLEIGGNPTDEKNLWPALWTVNSNGFDLGMHTKDRLENKLKQLVVSGKMKLTDAQNEIETDWPKSYLAHVGQWPKIGRAK